MIKYIVQMINAGTGAVLETLNEEFDTYEHAEQYRCECSGSYAEGAEVLESAVRLGSRMMWNSSSRK